MATPEREIPALRTAEGDWARVFSHHAFTPILDRVEGIYLYDTEGNRSSTASIKR